MSKWLRIDEQVPKDGQKVFYYFGVFDTVYTGQYAKAPEELGKHIFYQPGGYLTDDVTYWLPRKDNDPLPSHPTYKQKTKDLYHPPRHDK